MPPEKWIERTFSFDFPVEDYPQIIERLNSTPARVAELVAGLSEDVLRQKPPDSWSIQQHVGHLISVEDLFTGRLDDYKAGLEELRPADMSNLSTEHAGYNELPLEVLLAGFRSARERTVLRLESYPPEAFAKAAFHKRLGVTKRLVDSMFFFAEHDDHHLAIIEELGR
jgi:uncharacterized damage-inducible protein DinB